MAKSVSVDIGGTFTDLFWVDAEHGTTGTAKSLTTYDDLSRGVFNCLDLAGLSAGELDQLVHGSTIAINIAIQRTGAKTALVVTRGTRDVYEIGRGNRPQPYDVFFRREKPFVPRRLVFEAHERHLASGEVLTPLTREHAREVAAQVAATGAEAVAVCFLHSYAKPEHEAIMGEALVEAMPEAHISLSHKIVREYREYERTSTTVLNAYVGPSCRAYLQQLEQALEKRGFEGAFLIMQSNGGVMAPATARALPVAMMESGPVGGVIASAQCGRSMNRPSLITFDMGGTTAKMSLVRDAQPTISPGYTIGEHGQGHPIMFPVVDIVEIGAGGGSIAWIDEVGALHVGPRSAGSSPGPICYGLGGTEPTVTDANLILGRLNPANFLGGEMQLDLDGARRATAERLASLGMTVEELASGIVRLAVSSMVLAVRGVSVERGYDPRDFALVAQGGNGPLHALEVARELGIPEVIVPTMPGVFSAVGMLLADVRHDYVRTFNALLANVPLNDVAAALEELIQEGRDILLEENVPPEVQRFEPALDLRYLGQEFALTLPITMEQLAKGDREEIRAAYNQLHEERYGHAGYAEQVEIINLRMVAIGERGSKASLGRPPAAIGDGQPDTRDVWFSDPRTPVSCKIYQRSALGLDAAIEGPALIEEPNSSTLLWPGDRLELSGNGALVIKVGK